eukprot:6956688-Pyramimonas_sp.AAC.1
MFVSRAEEHLRVGDRRLRGHGAHKVDPGVARAAGAVLLSDLLDQGVRTVHRRARRPRPQRVRDQVPRPAERHREPGARRADLAGARYLGRAGDHRRARARRGDQHEGGGGGRHHRLQVAQPAALLLP